MDPRTAHPSRSLRHRVSRRGAQLAVPLLLTFGAAIVFNSSPGSAATSPTTDSISLVENGTTTLSESLPSGTPDVVTALATGLYDACAPLSSDILATSAVQVCDTEQFGPAAGTVVVVGVGSSAGVVLPAGFTCSPPDSGVVVVDGDSGLLLEPPGGPC